MEKPKEEEKKMTIVKLNYSVNTLHACSLGRDTKTKVDVHFFYMTFLESTSSSDNLASVSNLRAVGRMFKGRTFVFFWLCFCLLVGVFGDELKSVSVMEGESVTLQINVTELQTDDEIIWTFGANRNLLAKANGDFSKISIHEDALDGRFRDRLKLDNKTGSLTITNTRTTDSGLYEVTISGSRSETKHRFTVTVTAAPTTEPTSTSHSTSRPPSHPPSGSPSGSTTRPPSGSTSGSSSGSPSGHLIVPISAAAGAGFLLLVASVGIFCMCRKQRKTDQQAETREGEITYADPKFYKRNAPKSEDEVIYASVVTRR